MKILFFGSSEFSVPFLETIYNSKHEIVLVVTKPDRQKGRGKKVLPNPVKEISIKLGLKYFEINTFHEDFFDYILNIGFDFIVAVSFGKIIPSRILDMAEGRTVNVHPSILPKYRGPSPIISALLNGDSITGVSLIKIEKEVDSGDIYMLEKIMISEEDNRESILFKNLTVPLMISYANLLSRFDILLERKKEFIRVFNTGFF
ncbi:MAG: methionyl-tRNA formyltransferase, partial [Actinobacteria bacterium]|nr:methionyl-tRNA formyltransferase [Actinomycetota bacterium]